MYKNLIHLSLLTLFIFSACQQNSNQGTTSTKKTGKSHYKAKGVEKWIETMGTDTRIYYVQPPKITGRVLYVFHDIWGFNDNFKQLCDQFAADLDNTIIIGIDLYNGVSANTLPKAMELKKLITKKRYSQIIGAVTTFAGANSRIATYGRGDGGTWSLDVATMITNQGVGCVLVYGTPPQNAVDLTPLQCDILGIFAKQDDVVTAPMIQNFEKNCKITRKKLTIKTYDAQHDFADPMSKNYDANAAAMAYRDAVVFLKRSLR